MNYVSRNISVTFIFDYIESRVRYNFNIVMLWYTISIMLSVHKINQIYMCYYVLHALANGVMLRTHTLIII
jgi:hypothetical protein